MGVQALSPTSATLNVGDQWRLLVGVQDDDGNYGQSAPTVTLTDPAGTVTSPAMLLQTAGCWRVYYTIAAAGRHVARVVSAGFGAADFTAYANAIVSAAGLPVLADVKTYLGPTSFSDAEISDALNAEAASQRRRCRVPADYPADLGQALKRRVARNLALRGLPLAVLRGDADGGEATVLPGTDPEVRRLERDWRKVVLG